jgi:hypothetical protein
VGVPPPQRRCVGHPLGRCVSRPVDQTLILKGCPGSTSARGCDQHARCARHPVTARHDDWGSGPVGDVQGGRPQVAASRTSRTGCRQRTTSRARSAQTSTTRSGAPARIATVGAAALQDVAYQLRQMTSLPRRKGRQLVRRRDREVADRPVPSLPMAVAPGDSTTPGWGVGFGRCGGHSIVRASRQGQALAQCMAGSSQFGGRTSHELAGVEVRDADLPPDCGERPEQRVFLHSRTGPTTYGRTTVASTLAGAGEIDDTGG